MTTEFVKVRAAKHRAETFSSPLSRVMMNPAGLLRFAAMLTTVRRGDRPVVVAQHFLRGVSLQLFVLASRMADAGLEALAFMRRFCYRGSANG